jgi:hypothetical protein
VPSGDQLIVPTTSADPTWRGVPPSALTTQMPRLPPRSETKAICRPSGENAGLSSNAVPAVIGVGCSMRPFIDHRVRLPVRDVLNTSCDPSGDHTGSKSPE